MLQWRTSLMLLCLLSAPSYAQAPAPSEVRVEAKNGQEVRLVVVNNTSGDCSGTPLPDLTIHEGPRGGVLVFRHGQARFPQEAPRCAGREVPGIGMFYRSRPGFSGTEKIQLEVGLPGQPSQTQTFVVVVSP